MEELKLLVTTNWSTIVEYALMFVSYFLVFLYRNKVNGTKMNIDLAFKQFTKKFIENEANSNAQLEESKALYAAAVNTISKLEQKVKRLEETVACLLYDTVETDIIDAATLETTEQGGHENDD